jgi:hypothetical protein
MIEPEILMDGDHTNGLIASVLEPLVQEVDRASQVNGVVVKAHNSSHR